MKLNATYLVMPKVFHVGTMNAADKGVRGTSYEGKGLSVSTEPDAWVAIANLGGLPTHKLTKKDSKFLDFHKLLTKENKQPLYQWAKQRNIITTADVWKISKYDDEFEQTFVTYTSDPEEARQEREDAKEEETGVKVKKIKNFPVPTDEALDRVGIIRQDKLTSVHDVLALILAEELKLDGVWWDDDLDEERLSAPRGVILPHMLQTWKTKVLQN